MKIYFPDIPRQDDYISMGGKFSRIRNSDEGFGANFKIRSFQAQIVQFFVWTKRHTNLRQGVPNLGAVSGVSGRTRLLPSTPAHALAVLHNTLPTGHETSYNG